jgi:HAD superfamily hydrolase (TIGR01509 family)
MVELDADMRVLPSAVIVDFYGVICSEIAPFWLAEHFGAEEARRVKQTIVHHADLGLISEQEMYNKLGRLAGIAPDQVSAEWNGYVAIDEAVVGILAQLRGQHLLCLLTNSPSPLVRRLLDTNNLTALFDLVVVSSEVGCAKPDPTIYRRTVDRLSVGADRALMIDDNAANIQGAVGVGMKGLLFTSSSQMREALAAVDYL